MTAATAMDPKRARCLRHAVLRIEGLFEPARFWSRHAVAEPDEGDPNRAFKRMLIVKAIEGRQLAVDALCGVSSGRRFVLDPALDEEADERLQHDDDATAYFHLVDALRNVELLLAGDSEIPGPGTQGFPLPPAPLH